jgi:hypothetical protein
MKFLSIKLFARRTNSLSAGSGLHVANLQSKNTHLARLLSSNNNVSDSRGNDIDGTALFDDIRILCCVMRASHSVRSPLDFLR